MEENKFSGYVGRCYRTFCVIFFNKKHLKRDVSILGAIALLFCGFWLYNLSLTDSPENIIDESEERVLGEQNEPKSEVEAVAQEVEGVSLVQSQFDTGSWILYQNTWYGFNLKYPNDWNDPIVRKNVSGTLWEQQIQFRSKDANEKNPFEGFDMVIYDISRVKQIYNTEEYPKLKSEDLRSIEECKVIEGHLLETGNYAAEEVYIPANDACYNATLFFTNTKGNYVYNIVPRLKEGAGLAGDPADEIESHMPEFLVVASRLEFIDIVRPKPVVVKPKITAPKPVSYKTVNGKMVCEKKNDKPSKSDKNKRGHLDMECCLDPDEYPNSWCYYDSAKYGKYFK